MDQQMDTMSEQPQDPQEQQDQLDQQESVSADQPRDTAPDVTQTSQETPPEDTPSMNRPADGPGAAVNQQGQQDQEAAPAQRPQQHGQNTIDMSDMSAPPAGERPSPDGPSTESGTAGPEPDATPRRTAEGQGVSDAQPSPLLSTEVAGAFLERWDALQATFVDEPRQVVEQADSLVAEVMQRIAEVMAQERTGLERQWEAGDAASTEDLRIALQHYRSFFQRLLSA